MSFASQYRAFMSTASGGSASDKIDEMGIQQQAEIIQIESQPVDSYSVGSFIVPIR